MRNREAVTLVLTITDKAQTKRETEPSMPSNEVRALREPVDQEWNR
jgi:hypothetical protein